MFLIHLHVIKCVKMCEAIRSMPQHRKVPSLQTLSLRSVGSSAVRVAHKSATELLLEEENLQFLDWLKILPTEVPYLLYEDVAKEILEGVRCVQSTSKIREMNISTSIIELSLNPQLKSLDIARWPSHLHWSFYTNLHKLTGLEKLTIKLFETLRTAEYDNYLCESISAMKKLKSFTSISSGTDAIVQVIGNHCQYIEYLDLQWSYSVTDQSIPYLLKCKNLKTLKIDGTVITGDGLAQIFFGLPKLIEVECYDIGPALESLNNSSYGPFGLRTLKSYENLSNNLELFVKLFPKIESIEFLNRPLFDLSILAPLDNLKTLVVRFVDFRSQNLNQLEVGGSHITTMALEYVTGIEIQHIVAIGQYCPNLESFEVNFCELIDSEIPFGRFDGPLFKNLRKLMWVADGGSRLLQFVLSHTCNIEVIHVSLSTEISHGFVEHLLSTNRMRNLEIFSVSSGSDLNMRTVEILLEGCANLRALRGLQKWGGIREEDFNTFKEYMSSHNFDIEYWYYQKPRIFWQS